MLLLKNNDNHNATTLDKNWLLQYIDPELPRYQHILGVVQRMRDLLPKLSVPNDWQQALLQTCYLHDVGYSPQLNQNNYHQLDGAIFANAQGFSKPVVAAVLFHSCAYESAIPSRPDLVDIYEQNFSLLDDVDRMFIDLVSYCDLHTSATGECVTLQERVDDVVIRYGEDHEVSRLMLANQPEFEEMIDKANEYMG